MYTILITEVLSTRNFRHYRLNVNKQHFSDMMCNCRAAVNSTQVTESS